MTLAFLLLAINAQAFEYTCKVVGARQPGFQLVAKGELHITEVLTWSALRELEVRGSLAVDYAFNVEGEDYTLCYSSNFHNVLVTEKTDYRPRVYVGYSKFDDLDATSSHQCDGGGMWGYLVVEKSTSKPTFKAHYVFKAGDHMGGTFDFECSKLY